MTFTVKEICQKIWNLEEKYELNHKEIQGCYPWQLIRMYLYYEITRKTNVFESAQQSSLSLFDKINSFLPLRMFPRTSCKETDGLSLPLSIGIWCHLCQEGLHVP